jgi:ribosomal protein L37AE/L43A
MPKLFTVQQDIEALREAYQLAPCPFCASSEVELVRRKRAWVIACGNCHVNVTPPAWHQTTEAEAGLFWNRCRRPGAHTLDPYVVARSIK